MMTRHPMWIASSLAFLALACGDAGRLDTACTSNADCEPTELCASGLCGGVGVCNLRPEMCGDAIAPVCGCDGLTYQNQCLAEMAGVRLVSTGACVCGGNAECVTTQYCALDNSCLNRGGCAPRPDSCDPADTQAVCGCDRVTYDNECAAAQAGARVSALGSCECTSNTDCASSDYCGALVCDGPGNCQPRNAPVCDPEAPVEGCCDADRPVTGCDGVIYSSECDAISEGVRVRPDG